MKWLFGIIEHEEYGEGLLVCLTSKETWETKRCQDDNFPTEIYELATSHSLAELESGLFEVNSDLDEDQLRESLEELGWEYCEEFGQFCLEFMEE